MANTGDTVRYLNQTGGGVITRIEGKTAFVQEDNGFEMPCSIKDIVVVLPAGSKAKSGPALYFDQENYDKGRTSIPSKEIPAPTAAQRPVEDELKPVSETSYGNKLNIALLFEPSDIKNIDKSRFNAVLVNDSNYTLAFSIFRRRTPSRLWSPIYQGIIGPNELMDLAAYTIEDIPELEEITLQYIAYKVSDTFERKAPGNISLRPDLTKFYKPHCFRPGVYSDTPVLEIKLVTDDIPVKRANLTQALTERSVVDAADRNMARELASKYRIDTNRRHRNKTTHDNGTNPNKLLPLIEEDLHIQALLDSTAGLTPADMLGIQLDRVRKVMQQHRRRIGQKIEFIHGKGNGVLRKAVLQLLTKEYPTAELTDASFAEYGFGATLVTIHEDKNKR